MPEIIMGVMVISLVIAIIRYLIMLIGKAVVNLQRERTAVSGLFMNGYVESRALFMYLRAQVPSTLLIKGINVNEAMQYLRTEYNTEVKDLYQQNIYSFDESEIRFNITVYLLRNGIMIELGADYAEILYTSDRFKAVKELATNLASFKTAETVEAYNADRVQILGFRRDPALEN
jgi:hypothetical protein